MARHGHATREPGRGYAQEPAELEAEGQPSVRTNILKLLHALLRRLAVLARKLLEHVLNDRRYPNLNLAVLENLI